MKRCGHCRLDKDENAFYERTTGKIRALLCHGCNCGLGNFSEQPELLTRAAAYLTRHANDYPRKS